MYIPTLKEFNDMWFTFYDGTFNLELWLGHPTYNNEMIYQEYDSQILFENDTWYLICGSWLQDHTFSKTEFYPISKQQLKMFIDIFSKPI